MPKEIQKDSGSSVDPESPSRVDRVDKVAVAVKHPGVFMETSEMEAETGTRLNPGIEMKVVKTPLAGKIRSALISPTADAVVTETPTRKMTRRQKSEEEKNDHKQQPQTQPIGRPQEVGVSSVAEGSGSTSEIVAKVEEDVDKDAKETLEEAKEPEVAPEIEISHGSGDQQEESDEAKTQRPGQRPPQIGRQRRSRRKLEEKEREGDDKMKQKAEEVEPRDVEMKTEINEGGGGGMAMIPSELGELSEVDSESSELRDLDGESVGSSSTLTTRSSSRRRKTKGGPVLKLRTKGKNARLAHIMKGRGRRSIFKKSAAKAPTAIARTVTSDRVYYKGEFFTRGDIVSLIDVDGGVFYAQLKGFMTDQYCEKSGVITWLLPTTYSPRPEEGFDASTYVIGPEEELPRKLECMTFVMHAPDDYFFYKNAPYPTLSHSSDQEYLLTRGIPKVRLIKDGQVLFKDRIGLGPS